MPLEPLLEEIESLNERIKEYDRRIEQIGEEVYPEISLLKQVKGVCLCTSRAEPSPKTVFLLRHSALRPLCGLPTRRATTQTPKNQKITPPKDKTSTPECSKEPLLLSCQNLSSGLSA